MPSVFFLVRLRPAGLSNLIWISWACSYGKAKNASRDLTCPVVGEYDPIDYRFCRSLDSRNGWFDHVQVMGKSNIWKGIHQAFLETGFHYDWLPLHIYVNKAIGAGYDWSGLRSSVRLGFCWGYKCWIMSTFWPRRSSEMTQEVIIGSSVTIPVMAYREHQEEIHPRKTRISGVNPPIGLYSKFQTGHHWIQTPNLTT